MFSKKVLVAVLALTLVGGGSFYYGSGSELQGKFGGMGSASKTPDVNSTSSSTSSASTKYSMDEVKGSGIKTSDYYLTVAADQRLTNGIALYVSKSRPEAYNSPFTLGEFDVTLGKYASSLNSCIYKLGVYSGSTMYSYWTETSPNVFTDPAATVSDTSGVIETEDSGDINQSIFYTDFTSSLFSRVSGKTYTYEPSALFDSDITFTGATLGDTSTYAANTVDTYLTGITCSNSSGSFIWNPTSDANHDNSKFKVGSYDSAGNYSDYTSGKGLLLKTITIGE